MPQSKSIKRQSNNLFIFAQMDNYGFIRVAAATPKVKVADIKYNTEIICELIDKAEQDQVALLAFPELSVNWYSC